MSQTSPKDGDPQAADPSTKQPLLDQAMFEAYAKAAKEALAEGLARRALMAKEPPSKARH